MTTVTVLVLVFAGVFLAYTVGAPVLLNISRFLGRTWQYCPTHEEYARVGVHSLGAALTSGYGAPVLHVRRCNLLRPHESCDERCLEDARF